MLSIQNAKTPTLVIHGQKDYRLDVSEGLQLFDASRSAASPARCSTSPMKATGSSNPRTRNSGTTP
jgi:dipeptidyl aminopeptidase/acylaminoacyl peptidase